MNKYLEELIEKSKSENLDTVNDALTDLGLLVERHTQNRYGEEDYLTLLGNDEKLFNLRLTENEVELLTCFFFYHILNVSVHPVTVAWCLGKCYNMNILRGMTHLLDIFCSDDDVTLQLLYSINSLFGLESVMPMLLTIRTKKDLPNTSKYLEELESEGFFGSVMN